MAKHPVKPVRQAQGRMDGNSLNTQILIVIDKSINKTNSALKMKAEKFDKAIKKNLEGLGYGF